MVAVPDLSGVAIWGSCVTRDAFAFAARQSDLDRLDLRYYAARSSWVSQNSAPWHDQSADRELGGGLGEFGRRTVAEDLDKLIVGRLVDVQPRIVVLDLIDERLPLRRVGPTWLTYSQYLKVTTVGVAVQQGADESSHVMGPGRAHQFAVAALTLGQQLTRALPYTTFVLNQAPYTTRIAGGGTLSERQADSARALSRAQEPMIEAIAAAFGPRLVRAVPPDEVCLADPAHRWGLASYHFVDDYYHWLIDTLLAVEPVAAAPAPTPYYPDLARLATLAESAGAKQSSGRGAGWRSLAGADGRARLVRSARRWAGRQRRRFTARAENAGAENAGAENAGG